MPASNSGKTVITSSFSDNGDYCTMIAEETLPLSIMFSSCRFFIRRSELSTF